VLQIVADHADAATWDQLHGLAQKAVNVTDKTRLYRYLGVSHDPALADRALALALSKEPSPTDAPELIAGVASVYPEKAFDFAIANRAAVDTLIEPTSRTSYIANLAGGARDRAILPKLDAFAAAVPASTHGEITKAKSNIDFRLEIVAKRLPEVDRWVAAHPG
jgi:aminopeptidase N